MKLQPAVKQETVRILIGTAIGTALMILGFLLLHVLVPEAVPFDYRVILSAIIGALVATANFFLMAVAVQRVAGTENEDRARQVFTFSFRYRMILQLIWVVLSLTLPFLNGAAGIIPLLMPSMVIKVYGIITSIRTIKR